MKRAKIINNLAWFMLGFLIMSLIINLGIKRITDESGKPAPKNYLCVEMDIQSEGKTYLYELCGTPKETR